MKLPPEKKLAGILTPLFALRGTQDLGIGDIAALRDLLVWARDYEFRVVQLLPINETGHDHSPYNAISSVALDPTTIETTPGALPDLTEEDFSNVLKSVDLTALAAGPVQYNKVKTLKRALLRKAFDHFMATSWKHNDSRAHRFRAFRRAEAAWLDGYALFRVLMEENESGEGLGSLARGAADLRRGEAMAGRATAKRRREFRERLRFFIWVQWIASRSGTRCVSKPTSSVWRSWAIFRSASRIIPPMSGPCRKFRSPLVRWALRRNAFSSPIHSPTNGARTGACHCTIGRNCGSRNFDWWRQRVAKVRAVFHLFRIDHVLGFYRIYAFPLAAETKR
jgi:4-alpha-glucanotransferase